VYLIIYPGLLIVSFSIELFYLFFLQKYLHIGSSIVIAVVELAERFSVCDWQHLLSFLELNLLFLNFFFTCVVLWLHCRFRAFFFSNLFLSYHSTIPPFPDQLYSTKVTGRLTYGRWRTTWSSRCFGVGTTSFDRLEYLLSILVRSPLRLL